MRNFRLSVGVGFLCVLADLFSEDFQQDFCFLRGVGFGCHPVETSDDFGRQPSAFGELVAQVALRQVTADVVPFAADGVDVACRAGVGEPAGSRFRLFKRLVGYPDVVVYVVEKCGRRETFPVVDVALGPLLAVYPLMACCSRSGLNIRHIVLSMSVSVSAMSSREWSSFSVISPT